MRVCTCDSPEGGSRGVEGGSRGRLSRGRLPRAAPRHHTSDQTGRGWVVRAAVWTQLRAPRSLSGLGTRLARCGVSVWCGERVRGSGRDETRLDRETNKTQKREKSKTRKLWGAPCVTSLFRASKAVRVYTCTTRRVNRVFISPYTAATQLHLTNRAHLSLSHYVTAGVTRTARFCPCPLRSVARRPETASHRIIWRRPRHTQQCRPRAPPQRRWHPCPNRRASMWEPSSNSDPASRRRLAPRIPTRWEGDVSAIGWLAA